MDLLKARLLPDEVDGFNEERRVLECVTPQVTTRLDLAVAAPLRAKSPERQLALQTGSLWSRLESLWPQLPAVAVALIMSMVTSVTYGKLVFAVPGLPRNLMPDGVTLWLWTSAAAQLAATASSGMPAAVVAPVFELIPIYHAIYIQIIKALQGEDEEVIAGTCLAVTLVGTAVFGILAVAGSRLGVGRYLRAVPLVVLKGTLFGVGLFLMKSSLDMQVAGADLQPSPWEWPFANCFAVVALGTLLFLADEFWSSPGTVAALLILIATVPVAMSALGVVGIDELRDQGWLISEASPSAHTSWYLQLFGSFAAVLPRTNWTVALAQLPALFALWLTHALCMLTDVKTIEIMTQNELDLNTEMGSIGFCNAFSACNLGWPVYLSSGNNVTVHKLGGRTRLVGVLLFLGTLPSLALVGDVVPNLPLVLPGCVAWWLGILFSKETLLDVLKHHTHTFDVLIVMLMALLVMTAGFLQALLVGVVLSLVAFALQYSRSVGVIRTKGTGKFFRSNVARSAEQLAKLDDFGERIAVIHLEGYLMFGSSPELQEVVKPLLHRDAEEQWLVLSFRGVRGLDYSAVLDLVSLGRMAAQAGKSVVVTELRGGLLGTLKRAGLQMPQLEDLARPGPGLAHVRHYHLALKLCEDALLATFKADPRAMAAEGTSGDALRMLEGSFGSFLEGAHRAQSLRELLGFFELVEYAPGSVVWNAGDEATRCVGLVRGSLHLYQASEAGDLEHLVEAVAPSAFAGFADMTSNRSYFTRALVPEEAAGPCKLLVLKDVSFKRLKSQQPVLANAVVLAWLRRLACEYRVNIRDAHA